MRQLLLLHPSADVGRSYKSERRAASPKRVIFLRENTPFGGSAAWRRRLKVYPVGVAKRVVDARPLREQNEEEKGRRCAG